MVTVYTGDGSDLIALDVTGGSPAALSWPASPQPPGVSGYDVYRTTVSATDNGVPAVGEVTMYQVSHSALTPATINPLGTRPSSCNRAGQLVTAAGPCP